MSRTIGCSGLAQSRTGIGVVQRQVYARLESRLGKMAHSPRRDLGRGPIKQLLGLARGLFPPLKSHSAFLVFVPPMPFFVRGTVVGVVHDLRWQRTKGIIGRSYRKWDLGRMVRRSQTLICISDRTYDDLIEMFPQARSKALVSWLGPGIVPEGSFQESRNGLVLLVGGAKHKRNLEAVHLLASVRPHWLKGIVGVGMPQEVKSFVDKEFGESFGRWESNVSDSRMVELYQESFAFMMLGTDEGFGLPYVEALSAGCQVIVADQPLTRELLGESAIYVPSQIAAANSILKDIPDIPRTVRQEILRRFTWERFSNDILTNLSGACDIDLGALKSTRRHGL